VQVQKIKSGREKSETRLKEEMYQGLQESMPTFSSDIPASLSKKGQPWDM
jgi:hypothetical protein